jgi:adenylate cyclase
MGLEVERKFLVTGEGWRSLGEPISIRQGYLSTEPLRTVRVRVAGERAWLTVKGISIGASRLEFEYPIPLRDAADMLEGFCEQPVLEKRRTRIRLGEVVWEVDEFLGENRGLIVAEVELREAGQSLTIPDWIGAEVTGDPRYYNSHLRAEPYSHWGKSAERSS